MKWFQLIIGVIAMAAVANLQYGWTLFVNPINEAYGFGLAAIQVTFTIFVWSQTLLSPFEGRFVDRFGARTILTAAGLFAGISWVIYAYADAITLFYVGAIFAGLAAGCVAMATIGNALKWFPDRRGLAVGATVAGFGMGSIVTVAPLAAMITSSGYQTAFLTFGIGQALVVLLCAFFARRRRGEEVEAPALDAVSPSVSQRNYKWTEVLRTPAFWLMYVMFTAVATGGLMATAQLAVVAKDFQIADVPVSLLGLLTLPALVLALGMNQLMNGLSRISFGWISDFLGRERTMFCAFLVQALALYLLTVLGGNPFWFVALSALIYFSWGQIFALFPATSTDFFGPQFATTNYGMLYTAKGAAAVLVPLGNVLATMTGSWDSVFMAAVVLDLVAAILALVLLRMRRRHVLNASVSLQA